MAKGTKVVVLVDGVKVGQRVTKRVEGYPFAIVSRETPESRKAAAAYQRQRAAEHREQREQYRTWAASPVGTVIRVANNYIQSRDVVAEDNDPRIVEQQKQSYSRPDFMVADANDPKFATSRNLDGRYTLIARSTLSRFAIDEGVEALKCVDRADALDAQAARGEYGEWGVNCYAGRRDLAMKAADQRRLGFAGRDSRGRIIRQPSLLEVRVIEGR